LVDPDKVDNTKTEQLVSLATNSKVDYFFSWRQLVNFQPLDECVKQIKALCNIPVVLFPGSPSQVSKYADALLYLSLISGRNAELLIGQHVVSAPFVRKSGLEIMPTGYMVIDGGALQLFRTFRMPLQYLRTRMKLLCVLQWQVKCWV
jgi:putative glycerol-1-phosphate prenyltransferase